MGQSRPDDRPEQVTETVLGERRKRGENPKVFSEICSDIMDRPAVRNSKKRSVGPDWA